jgi:myo-inositol-1(or 4)-monophosphatase
MTKEPTSQELLRFIEPVIREAGHAILSFFQGDFRIERKNVSQSHIDIVTDADRESEEIILRAINKEFPDHDILSEERPPQTSGARWIWMVDPLDGTVNFAHGYPMFSVSVAAVRGDRIMAGMIYDPLRRELFSAAFGEGAYLNGRAIRTSKADKLIRSVIATGFPYDRAHAPDNNVAEFSRVVTRVQGLRRGGSAALDLAYTASGRLDGFWEFKLKPWDMAAGMLMVQEAGGRVSDRNGDPADVYTYCVVATNGLVHDELVELLLSS